MVESDVHNKTFSFAVPTLQTQQSVEAATLILPTVMNIYMHRIPSEIISTVYFVNQFNHEYQHCSLANCIVLLTSLRNILQFLYLRYQTLKLL
jgi:hypothetical protein